MSERAGERTCCSSHLVLCCSLLFSSSMAFLRTDGRRLLISPFITMMKVSVGNREFTLVTEDNVLL